MPKNGRMFRTEDEAYYHPTKTSTKKRSKWHLQKQRSFFAKKNKKGKIANTKQEPVCLLEEEELWGQQQEVLATKKDTLLLENCHFPSVVGENSRKNITFSSSLHSSKDISCVLSHHRSKNTIVHEDSTALDRFSSTGKYGDEQELKKYGEFDSIHTADVLQYDDSTMVQEAAGHKKYCHQQGQERMIMQKVLHDDDPAHKILLQNRSDDEQQYTRGGQQDYYYYASHNGHLIIDDEVVEACSLESTFQEDGKFFTSDYNDNINAACPRSATNISSPSSSLTGVKNTIPFSSNNNDPWNLKVDDDLTQTWVLGTSNEDGPSSHNSFSSKPFDDNLPETTQTQQCEIFHHRYVTADNEMVRYVADSWKTDKKKKKDHNNDKPSQHNNNDSTEEKRLFCKDALSIINNSNNMAVLADASLGVAEEEDGPLQCESYDLHKQQQHADNYHYHYYSGMQDFTLDKALQQSASLFEEEEVFESIYDHQEDNLYYYC